MLETIALIIGLAVIIAIVVGAGLFSLMILGGIFFVILFLTKTILVAILILLVLASPFLALSLLAKVCQGRTVPGTSWPLGKAIVIGGILLLILAALGVGQSVTGVNSVLGDMKAMMEQCDIGGDHTTDMTMGDRHYHFSCKSSKPAPEQHDM